MVNRGQNRECITEAFERHLYTYKQINNTFDNLIIKLKQKKTTLYLIKTRAANNRSNGIMYNQCTLVAPDLFINRILSINILNCQL